MWSDYIIEELAAAQQRDRRSEAARNARLAQALRGNEPQARTARNRARRAAIANTLRALAQRLTPVGEGPDTARGAVGSQT